MVKMAVIRGLLRVLIAALAGLGLLMTVVTFTPLASWYARRLAGSWDDARGDVLIVVAAERIDGDTLGLSSYWRSVYAGRAWRAGGFRRVVVAGAGVAPLIRDFLVGHGVPRSNFTVAPSDSRICTMNRVSLKSGTRRMTHGSLVSSVAAMMGSAAFLLPLISTSPCNGTPPLIKKLSMRNPI